MGGKDKKQRKQILANRLRESIDKVIDSEGFLSSGDYSDSDSDGSSGVGAYTGTFPAITGTENELFASRNKRKESLSTFQLSALETHDDSLEYFTSGLVALASFMVLLMSLK